MSWREPPEECLDRLLKAAELAYARSELAGCEGDSDTEVAEYTEAAERYFLQPTESIRHLYRKLHLFVKTDSHELINAAPYLRAFEQDARAILLNLKRT